jgi:hypothetical protein
MNDRRRSAESPRLPAIRRVGLDAFGNAIPDVPSTRAARPGRSLQVVATKQLVERRPETAAATGEWMPRAGGLLAGVARWGHAVSAWRPRGAVPAALPDEDDSRLEYAFRRLHEEFGVREQRLQAQLHELDERQQRLLGHAPWKWVAPLALVAALALGYALYLLAAMQESITGMAGDVATMNGHMDGMADSTRTMSENMDTVNRSMAQLNGDMGQMNRNVGAIAAATAPMGQAVQSVSPFMQTFRRFMPF